MKPSGIEWIGDIPDDWKIVKTGRIFHNIKEIVRENSASIERLALTLNGVIKRRKDDAEGLQPQQFDGYQYLRKNQLVFKLIDLENINTSRVGLCPFEEGMVSPAYIVLQNYSIDNRFYHYYFLSLWHNEIFNHLGGDGVRSALNAKDLLNIPTFDIPHQTQQKIADYLDEKCGEIDKTIEKQKESIEKLKAYKQSLISETVTKGLNKSTPLKPSGIDFLGDIPTHWEVKKLKYGVRLIEEKEKAVRSISLENIESFTGKLIETENIYEGEGIAFQPYDILFGKLRPYLAKVYLSAFKGQALGDFYVLRAKQDILPNFLKFVLLSDWFIKIVDSSTYGTKMPRASWDFVASMKIIFPPIKEQNQIAVYLDKKCTEIDSTINKKQKIIEKLDAYKKSLIFECVTGKRKI